MVSPQADARALSALLERHEEALFGVPSVTGAAVGIGPDGEPAVHVYAASEEAVPTVRSAAERILANVAVEVIATGVPEAHESD